AGLAACRTDPWRACGGPFITGHSTVRIPGLEELPPEAIPGRPDGRAQPLFSLSENGIDIPHSAYRSMEGWGQHGFEPFFDQLAAGAKDVGDTGIQRLGDPAVARALARLRHIGLQQDTGLRQQLGGTLAFADQVVELCAFVRAQPHNVFLDGNLFRGHESPPALACATVIQKTTSDSMT